MGLRCRHYNFKLALVLGFSAEQATLIDPVPDALIGLSGSRAAAREGEEDKKDDWAEAAACLREASFSRDIVNR